MLLKNPIARVSSLIKLYNGHWTRPFSVSPNATISSSSLLSPLEVQYLCNLVCTTVGSLDELEHSLTQSRVSLTSSLIVKVINQCKVVSPSRRLLRFFTWSSKMLNHRLEDKDYNNVIQVFAELKDHRAIQLLLSELQREGRELETTTFSVLADVLVKLGKEDEALGIFKNLDKFKCPQDKVTVTSIVTALCAKGHARRAEGVVWHHKDKIAGNELCVYRSLLYGWSVKNNVKEARRVLQEMKSKTLFLDIYCYNIFLRCLCQTNLKRNPSGLVPEALNVMMEMRSYNIMPTSVSYNILLSFLSRTRRVKESINIFESMKKSGCHCDWVSYYLVVRVHYLSGRFGKGNQIVEQMLEEGLVPPPKFYYDLVGVLCGVERVNFALHLFDHMKASSVGGYGPVYDILIPKLCRNGDFEKGRELWNEAESMGVALSCSCDVLDPSITEVFVPRRNEEKIKYEEALQIATHNQSVKSTQLTKHGKKRKDKSATPRQRRRR